jgi:hypothetical protein
MISGTDFTFENPEFVTHACANLRPGVATASEIAEIRAECEAERAMCLACEDGMVVVQLRALPDALELFVWIAVAFRHGAFERQVAALLTVATELGAETLAFVTRRRGWARRLGPEWARRGTEEFVRQVRHG